MQMVICGRQHPDDPDLYRMCPLGLGHTVPHDFQIKEIDDLIAETRKHYAEIKNIWGSSTRSVPSVHGVSPSIFHRIPVERISVWETAPLADGHAAAYFDGDGDWDGMVVYCAHDEKCPLIRQILRGGS